MAVVNEFEFLLFDRIEKIKQINEEYDLENNAYISFSGGKDSTILHYLIDLALPNNKIPRVFINTGIEYNDIVNYVKELAKTDDRIIVYNSGVKIKQMLENYGYPFKSKVFAENLMRYQKNKVTTEYIKQFLCEIPTAKGLYRSGAFACPDRLKYMFESDFDIKISNLCCSKLKKETTKKWMKDNNRSITLTGMRAEEGGNRLDLTCITDNGKKIHFLAPLKKDFNEHFLERYNIKLCKLYYPPYNLERTGCKGCPFNRYLQQDLDMMRELLPKEYKQCETIWKPVYDEYRRIGYRLRKDTGQLTIFDFIESE